jgi:hypothetical protein
LHYNDAPGLHGAMIGDTRGDREQLLEFTSTRPWFG